jgi:outer membrane protein insertion porin family
MATAKLHPGDVASRQALIDTLLPLDQAYREQGYMDVTIVARPALDKAKHEVACSVTVTPGEPYRLSEVTTANLDPAGHADFDRGFAMKTGDLYNPEYVTEFLKKNSALPGLRPYTGNFRAYAHPATHTVELVITFLRNNR